MFRQLAPFVGSKNGIAGLAIVVLALHDPTRDALAAWFVRHLAAGLRPESINGVRVAKAPLATPLFSISDGSYAGHVAWIGVGLAEAARLRASHQIGRLVIDDYLPRVGPC